MMGRFRIVILFGLLLGLILGCNRSPSAGEMARPAEVETSESSSQESDLPTVTPNKVTSGRYNNESPGFTE